MADAGKDHAPAAELTIGDVVKATGVSEATLRAWERRFGFPLPQRLPGGHRRYSAEDVERIARVAEEREGGLALPVAIERARSASTGVPSIFATLRRLRPDIHPVRMAKRQVLALSHAIEEESGTRGEQTLLIGSFQRQGFYRRSEARWRELGEGAAVAIVFADFAELAEPDGGPVEIPLERSHPVSREWSLICEAPEHAACMVGWERPARGARHRDLDRLFEVLISVEPAVVREAAETAAAIAAPLAPELAARVRARLEAAPAPRLEFQLRLATAIFSRTLSALD